MKNTLPYFTILLSLVGLGSGCSNKRAIARHKAAVLFQQSQRYAAEGNMVQALQLINQALECTISWQLLLTKANYAYMLHDFNSAVLLFEQALRDTSIAPAMRCEITNNYACTLQQLGRCAQAHTLWERIGNDPAYVTPEVAWFNLGIHAWHEQHWHEALGLFNRALDRCPEYIDALFYKAMVVHEQGDNEHACALLQQVLTIMPEHEPARALLHAWRRALSEIEYKQ